MKSLITLLALVACTGPSLASCDLPKDDAEKARCIGEELRRSDAEINRIYAELRGKLAEPERLALRDAQRRWLKERDQTCTLNSKESDRQKWYAALLADYGKTVCVVRYTDRRAAELRSQLASLDKPASQAPSPTMADAADIYDMTGHATLNGGRWYFEVKLAPGEIAKQTETALFIGIATAQSGSTGVLETIRKRDIGRQPVNIGIAVDLVEGKLYQRRNGVWLTEPGSSKGLDVKLGRLSAVRISSSTALDQVLKDHLIEINLGQQPFVYSVPDGYVAVDPSGPVPLPQH